MHSAGYAYSWSAKVMLEVKRTSHISFEEAVMEEQLYTCNDRICRDSEVLYDVGEVIEHLRRKHKLLFSRQRGLGSPDRHGHIWYCFYCKTKTGKNHRSFDSHKAMWDHLNDRHDDMLDTISLQQWAQDNGLRWSHGGWERACNSVRIGILWSTRDGWRCDKAPVTRYMGTGNAQRSLSS